MALLASTLTPVITPHRNDQHLQNWWKTNHQQIKVCIFTFLLSSLACLVLLLILWFFFGRRLKEYIIRRFKRPAGPSIFSSHLIPRVEDLAFLENDEELGKLEVVGRGACGKVYKKELTCSPKLLDQPSTVIAIKRIMKHTINNDEMTSDEDTWMLDPWVRQVRSEIQTVGRIRHPNLLPLLAHVPRPDCHYLIYEYMKNGSLESVLRNVADGYLQLDWPVRYKIAVGIAYGLNYLHHHHRPQIIHRDMKPANILLDGNMEPKIADFGLAKLMPEAHTHMTSSNVAGTFGYIAPEYYQTFKYTTKCDIYSFGVILAALVIGKLPSDDFFHSIEEYSLVKWLRNMMNSENAFEAIDAKLEANGYEEQMLLVLKIACFCTSNDPKERPDIKDVKVMLAQIEH